MSALLPKADMNNHGRDVRFVPIRDLDRLLVGPDWRIIQTKDVRRTMTNLLKQAINCEDGDRAAKIIQGALGIENAELTKRCFPKAWPADREQRARIIGEWLQMEAFFQADTHMGQMAGSQNLPTGVPDEHQPSCFALEEERGENWKGTGAATSAIKEAKPTL